MDTASGLRYLLGQRIVYTSVIVAAVTVIVALVALGAVFVGAVLPVPESEPLIAAPLRWYH